MNEIILNILSVVITAVVLPLISLGGTELIKLINSKIKNDTATKLLTEATTVVTNAVRFVLQTYVDTLKASGKFDLASQRIALEKAKKLARETMNDEVQKYIETTYGDIDTWITTMIEATINAIKANK